MSNTVDSTEEPIEDSPHHIRECLQISPTTAAVDPETIHQHLISIHSMCGQTSGSNGVLSSLSNSLSGTTPVNVECLVISEGQDEPIEVYYTANTDLTSLKQQLENLYPSSFEVTETSINLKQKLIRPLAFSPQSFAGHLLNGNLLSDPEDVGVDSNLLQADSITMSEEFRQQTRIADSGHNPSSELSPTANSDLPVPIKPDARATFDPDLHGPTQIPDTDHLTELDQPTVTPDGTVVARPDDEYIQPYAVRWEATEERKKDWMTAAKTATLVPNEYNHWRTQDREQFQPSSLIDLMEHLISASDPVAFQVVAKPKQSWRKKADYRIQNLNEGQDTMLQKLFHSRENIREADKERIQLIKAKNSNRSFEANVRLLSAHTPLEIGDEDTPSAKRTYTDPDSMAVFNEELRTLLNPLDGEFYQFEGHICNRTTGRLSAQSEAMTEWQRLVSREVVSDATRGMKETVQVSKSHPNLILSPKTLADLFVIPSAETFSGDLFRSTTAHHEDRSPLPCPSPDVIEQFDGGATVGYPITEDGTQLNTQVSIPKRLLQQHFGVFAGSGAGKSIKIANLLLSMKNQIPGPEILFEPKGDNMCIDYIQAHYSLFGSIDDIYYFKLPEQLPVVSFFDIRPALAAGRSREEAVQDRIDHFHSIMEVVMGEDRYNSAYVAKQTLSYLIKAQFDREHGANAFTIDDVMQTATELYRHQKPPRCSSEVENTLGRLTEKPERDFDQTLSAVFARLDRLKENSHVYRMLNQCPDWDLEQECYTEECLTFTDLINKDIQLLFDTGGLRSETREAFTIILLSTLWDDLQWHRRSEAFDPNKQVNLIIEESAPIAAKELVYEQLIPKARAFNLSLGLVMQFPSQVKDIGGQRAYNEVMNNIQNKIYGKIEKPDDYLEGSIAVDEVVPEQISNKLKHIEPGHWIADLSARFGDSPTTPFSIQALDVPTGHPASDNPLPSEEIPQFKSALQDCLRRTEDTYTLLSTTPEEPRDSDETSTSSTPNQEQTESISSSDPLGGTCVECDTPIGSDMDRCPDCLSAKRRTDTTTTSDNHNEPTTHQDTDSGSIDEDLLNNHGTQSKTTPDSDSSLSPDQTSDAAAPTDASDDTSRGLDKRLIGSGEINSLDDVYQLACCVYREKPYDQVMPNLMGLSVRVESEGFDVHERDLLTHAEEQAPIPSTLTPPRGQSDDASTSSTEAGDDSPTATTDSPSSSRSTNTEQDQSNESNGAADWVESIPKAIVQADPEEMERLGVTQADVNFLGVIAKAYHRELDDYSLTESMSGFTDRVDDPDVAHLKEKRLVKKASSRRKYYNLTQKGWDLIDMSQYHIGDWTEKILHRVGVTLVERSLHGQDEVDRVESYYEHESGYVFDLAAFNRENTLVQVAEVECESNNMEAVIEDYQKMAEIDAESLWICDKLATVDHVMKSCKKIDEVPEPGEWPSAQHLSKLNEKLSEWGLSGMSNVTTYNQIRSEIDE